MAANHRSKAAFHLVERLGPATFAQLAKSFDEHDRLILSKWTLDGMISDGMMVLHEEQYYPTRKGALHAAALTFVGGAAQTFLDRWAEKRPAWVQEQ